MAEDNDDSMLMPPPPPRLLKRQKTDLSLNEVASAGELTHPHSIFIPPPSPSLPSGVGDENFFGNTPCSDERTRSMSPEDLPESSAGRVAKHEFEAEKISGGGAKSAATQSHVESSFNRDDCFAVNENSRCIEGGDAFHDTRSSAGKIPLQNGSKKNKQSTRGHDSPPPGDVEYFGDLPSNGERSSMSPDDPMEQESSPKETKQSVSFRDIIGHGQAKLRLDEALLPLALPPDLADSVLSGIRAAPASILLHGPPGCGKTKLAKAVAGEAQAAFISVGPSDILSKFVGESEASIRGLFREARVRAKKMESKCAVVFFDEIDALGRSRVDEDSGKMSQAGGDNSSRRVLAELLIQMTELSNDNGGGSESETEGEEYEGGGYDDGDSFAGRSTISTGTGSFSRNDDDMQQALGPRPMSPMSAATHSGTKVTTDEQQEVGTPTRSGEGNNNFNPDKLQQPKPRVIVVAATNRPEDCDAALLRRFAVRVLVGLPSRKDRKKIIRRLLSDVEHNITPSQLGELSLATEGWSGSDLECEAVMAPVRECLRAAAIQKKIASKAQRSGAGSSQTQEQKTMAEDAENATRESLLNSFRNLRHVSSKDFEDGIAFFLGDQQDSFQNAKQAHYDSSSSSEDEE